MNNEPQFQQQSSGHTPLPPIASSKSARAALCAIIPGIGAVYNREYVKAVVHFAVFAGLMIIADEISVFSLAAFSYYIYTIIDAYRSAEAIAKGRDSQMDVSQEINMPLWGGVLIGMGVLFLLDNLGAIRLRSAVQFWPVILIFLGGYLIYQFARRKPAPAEAVPPPPYQSQPSAAHGVAADVAVGESGAGESGQREDVKE
ncbi:MAG: hypothetical protein JSU96_09875 [Acidobacteriota bacterium]|nr:MAG: hypothetical protein JSU96_09875 [Acidobacteriota bacterium]